MINDQFVVDALYQAGLWQNQNLYFMAEIKKPAWKTALEFTNVYAAVLSKASYAILNQTETGIGILPVKITPADATALPQAAGFIPNTDIAGVKFSSAFLAKKVTIRTRSGKPSSFVVVPNNTALAQHNQNFAQFVALYSQP